MKKIFAIVLISLGFLSGGCSMALPITPLLFLLKNDQPAPARVTPDSPNPAVPSAAPIGTANGDDSATVGS